MIHRTSDVIGKGLTDSFSLTCVSLSSEKDPTLSRPVGRGFSERTICYEYSSVGQE